MKIIKLKPIFLKEKNHRMISTFNIQAVLANLDTADTTQEH